MPGEAIVTELRQQLQDCQVQAGRMLKQAKEEADKTHLEEMTRLELRHDQVCSLFILQPVVFMILTMPLFVCTESFGIGRGSQEKSFRVGRRD